METQLNQTTEEERREMTTPERPCPIASAVADAIIERSRVGLAKYGVNAARTDLTTIQWLTHLQQELMDAAVYIERMKRDFRLEPTGRKQRKYKTTETRMAQIVNDLAENMNSRTKAELIDVVNWQQDQLCDASWRYAMLVMKKTSEYIDEVTAKFNIEGRPKPPSGTP